jgi:hypothetical protein
VDARHVREFKECIKDEEGYPVSSIGAVLGNCEPKAEFNKRGSERRNFESKEEICGPTTADFRFSLLDEDLFVGIA